MPFDATKPANSSPLSSAALQAQEAGDINGTAHNPNGQFGNFDPNWSPSGDTNSDFIYLRDRLTDLYNILAR